MISGSRGRIHVDSGAILISDAQWYEKHGGYAPDGRGIWHVSITPGTYRVKYGVSGGCLNFEFDGTRFIDTPGRVLSGEGLIDLPTGELIISDPCYGFHGWDRKLAWLDLTESTHDLSDMKTGEGVILINDIGGDGSYTVQVSLTRVYE